MRFEIEYNNVEQPIAISLWGQTILSLPLGDTVNSATLRSFVEMLNSAVIDNVGLCRLASFAIFYRCSRRIEHPIAAPDKTLPPNEIETSSRWLCQLSSCEDDKASTPVPTPHPSDPEG